jgi:hypothetical protein
LAQETPDVANLAQSYNATHADLPRSAGMPAQLANEEYVEALARIVYYWAYPAIDVTSRTSMWELMKKGPGLMFGIGPRSQAAPKGLRFRLSQPGRWMPSTEWRVASAGQTCCCARASSSVRTTLLNWSWC